MAVVDDHYAVRLGLDAALKAQSEMTPVGAASCAAEVAPLLYRTAPDVLVVDYRLPDEDGLSLCLRLHAEPAGPALLLHSAFAEGWLTLPALVAGADGIVHKGATGHELAEAIRAVADGRAFMPAIAPELLTAAIETLDPEDHAVFGLLVHGSSSREICDTLALTRGGLHERRARMLAALRVPAAD